MTDAIRTIEQVASGPSQMMIAPKKWVVKAQLRIAVYASDEFEAAIKALQEFNAHTFHKSDLAVHEET